MNKNDFNESKNKTERNCIQKHNINLIKRVNLKNKAIKYHSNQISLNKISLNETDKIVEALNKINIEFKKENNEDLAFLNGENVSKLIREKDVNE